MDPAPAPLGVAAASPAPPPAWPGATPWAAPRVDLPAVPRPAGPPAWPRPAQAAAALLLLLAAGLLAWHAYGGSRRATRPTTLEEGALTYRVDLNRADRAQFL